MDNTLLTVRGFDPGSRQFQYDVNPRFGRPADRAFLYRAPFSFSIQARVAVGADRVDAAFQKVIDATSNRDQVMTPENLARHHSQQIPHTAAEVLSLNGPRRLDLTPDQVVQLQQAADSVQERRAQLIKALVANITATAGKAEGAAQTDLTTLVREAVALRRAQMDAVRTILTPEQWRKLPSQLRIANNSFAPYPPERITAPSEY